MTIHGSNKHRTGIYRRVECWSKHTLMHNERPTTSQTNKRPDWPPVCKRFCLSIGQCATRSVRDFLLEKPQPFVRVSNKVSKKLSTCN